MRRLLSNGLTGLDMLNIVVPFTIADAVCDTDFAVGKMSKNVDAFGIVGHDVVVKFKEEELVRFHWIILLPQYTNKYFKK